MRWIRLKRSIRTVAASTSSWAVVLCEEGDLEPCTKSETVEKWGWVLVFVDKTDFCVRSLQQLHPFILYFTDLLTLLL
jgi:hypothetical protein